MVVNILYAIGIQQITRHGIEIGMTHGPTTYEREMLNCEGINNKYFITKLLQDGSHQLIWRWNEEKDEWMRWHPRVINKKTRSTILSDINRSGLDVVYIGRGSKWGNPFKIGKDGNREEVITKYFEYLLGKEDLLEALPELENKFLECFCSPLACHGDILIDLANPIIEIPNIPNEPEDNYPSDSIGSQEYVRMYKCSEYTQNTSPEERNPTEAYKRGFDDGVKWERLNWERIQDDDIPF